LNSLAPCKTAPPKENLEKRNVLTEAGHEPRYALWRSSALGLDSFEIIVIRQQLLDMLETLQNFRLVFYA